ncbi:hypothetical protein AGMMS4957_01530 [Bacteroidia bacterium]|nr:hypothetical protein AGMMS4957_01530 [Bacteroidia bacterium]
MAIPVRSFIPVLEGEVARRFEREARKAERERGTIKFSQEQIDGYKKIIKKFNATYGIS